MKGTIIRLFLIMFLIITYKSAFAQKNNQKSLSGWPAIDSVSRSGIVFKKDRIKPEISLSTDQAIRFLQRKTQPQYWKEPHNILRHALNQLIYEASHPRFDSVEFFLNKYPYDSLNIPWDKFYIWEPLNLKIPVINASDLHLPPDSAGLLKRNSADSLINKQLTVIEQSAVSSDHGMKDITILVSVDTLNEVASSRAGFPFKYFRYPYQSDSIKVAVRSLLKYIDIRDSSIIRFTGAGDRYTDVWMNSGADKMVRFWLKNEFSDSVTVWIGAIARDTIGLYLEKGVSFRRPGKQSYYSGAYVNVKEPDRSKLLDINHIEIKYQYWKYHSEASFLLSQAALSNWVKGGENSIATSMDITGYADYKNPPEKISSNNFIRLNLGFLKSGNDQVKKNLDLLETNSKLNHKAFGKFDFSAIMLFKTQVAPGRIYLKKSTEGDSAVTVSKFMNPGILTVGLGLDFKPNKTTSINFSPLSYRLTFVTDTALIDQTLYGVPKDRKSMHEPGASFMITNELKPFKAVTVINRLQLFTNYIHNPQNIDIDWEMIAVANLNWFTDVRFNTHLMFDDDTKTVVIKNGEPELRPDGSQRKTARIQFKEMIGFSLVFRF